MIEFKYPKEKEILSYYAHLLNNQTAIQFLLSASVESKEEVRVLAKFYWEIVDASIEEENIGAARFEDMEKWLERIYTSLHIYFNNIGLEEAWESEIP